MRDFLADPEAQALPIHPRLPEIARLLEDRGLLVLKAEPGAGKTSLVPAYLALRARLPGRICVLEPRRVAAVQAAARLAELLGARLGGEVGYRVRGESRISAETRLEVMTEGLFIRLIGDDPGLKGYGLVIFDEFHERSLGTDLALALARETRELRPELRLLLMSATMDAEALAARLSSPEAGVQAASLTVPGRAYPVETKYAALEPGRPVEEGLAELLLNLARESSGDILAFLPGKAEIERCARALGSRGLEPRRLHASLPLSEQRAVIRPDPGAPRRIILSTSLAETSLTVPRITAVLDSGLARLSRFEVRSGMNRLVTEREAKDRADQRRGRAGRLGPGTCLRAFSAAESLPERTEPELLRAELSGAALEAALWGARNPPDLPWLDPPPEASWKAARDLLGLLGALDASGAPTDKARRMARLGTEPRLAALTLHGLERGEAELAVLLAALLSEQEGADSDLELALERLLSRDPAFLAAQREAERLSLAAGIRLGSRKPQGSLGDLLASAFPDRVAKRIEVLPGGREGRESRVRIPGGRVLRARGALAEAEWIVAADADAGREEGRVYSGTVATEAEALEALAPLITVTEEIAWSGRSYRSRRVKKAGALVLTETALGALPRAAVAEALAARVMAEGFSVLLPDPEAESLLARLRWFLSRLGNEGGKLESRAGKVASASIESEAPDFSDAALAREARDWLRPFVESDPKEVLPRGALSAALRARLPYALSSRLEEAAPAYLDLPSGSRRPVLYGEGPEPVLEARVQEFYGLKEHPKILGQALILRLLSPAGRPVQVTADLPGFWKGSWLEARKELRGRYPKHEWPENPAEAQPSRSGIKRR